MRLIDADELQKKESCGLICARNVRNAPTVDAEPVRHEGHTTFIDTNNLEGYADRIIVGQGTQCKVYYADESVRHGRWELETSKYLRRCSACEKVTFCRGAGRHYDYCPNCGAKMDMEVQDD